MTVGTAGVVTAGVLGLSLLFPRRAPVARWRQRRRWDYIPIDFMKKEDGLLLDAPRRRLIHIYFRRLQATEAIVTLMDLDTWAHRTLVWPTEPRDPVHYNTFQAVLHPREGTVWIVDQGLGPVWRLAPEIAVLTRLPGGMVPEAAANRSFGNASYWNPVTGRLGVLGGYGVFSVHNARWEFEARTGQWVNVEPNRPGMEPRGRANAALMPADGGRSLLWFGGSGSLNGRQDVADPGEPHFDGRFHRLGDLWRLDLASGQWTSVVPFPGLTGLAASRWSACYLEAAQAVLVLQARSDTDPYGTPATLHLCRVGQDRRFHEVRNEGDVPDGGGHGFLTALPGGRSAVTFQKQGVFEVSLEEG
jgi:hypothetical protein